MGFPICPDLLSIICVSPSEFLYKQCTWTQTQTCPGSDEASKQVFEGAISLAPPPAQACLPGLSSLKI